MLSHGKIWYNRSMIDLNDNAIEYMHRLGFRDIILAVEKYTT